MYQSLFLIYFLINTIYTDNHQCLLLNKKLNKYEIKINNQEKDFLGLRICQGLIQDICCPQIYEDKIQNATAIELYHLFELYSINLYEPLLRLTIQFNETITKLIESSRNETHFILQHGYKTSYHFYRSSIDLFYNKLFRISSKNYQYNIKNNIEELFRNILRITIGLNNDYKTILPSYFLCLWKNHPFGNRPNLIINKLEIYFEKLYHLNELFKLSIELIQVISTSVTTDYHCIDSYMQLSYCNLCSGRNELPCSSNCANVIESCLVNVTLINDAWMNFIDSFENAAYFNGIEKVFTSIGLSISDALITFFNSDGIQNKDIIDQCGSIHIQKELFANDQQFHDQYKNSLLSSSLFDPQLMLMRQSLEVYRSFWLMLPKEICKSTDLSISNEKVCWTGISISQDKRESIRMNYDKPLSLRVQWILKEMKEKSQIIRYKQQVSTTASIIKNSHIINEVTLNLTDDFDDYPNDNEFDYSDDGYEDPIDGLTSSTTTTTTTISSTTFQSSSISIYDDILIDDANTVSYYDYAEPDVYTDDEVDEISTQKFSFIPTATTTITTVIRIPSYHQRQPIIWNINIDDNNDLNIQNSSSSSPLNSSFLFLFFIFNILT